MFINLITFPVGRFWIWIVQQKIISVNGNQIRKNLTHPVISKMCLANGYPCPNSKKTGVKKLWKNWLFIRKITLYRHTTHKDSTKKKCRPREQPMVCTAAQEGCYINVRVTLPEINALITHFFIYLTQKNVTPQSVSNKITVLACTLISGVHYMHTFFYGGWDRKIVMQDLLSSRKDNTGHGLWYCCCS